MSEPISVMADSLPATPPRLSVIVPATDRPATLAACLTAIHASSAPPHEVIVVDEPALLPPAAARNLGAQRATGDIFVFIDSDVVVRHDALERLGQAFAEEDLDAVFGAYDDEPAHRSRVSSFRNLLHHHTHVQAAGPADTFWTGLGAVRRRSFERIGGFDERRYRCPSIEDIEFGVRLRSAGGAIRLDPSIQGTHHKRWTVKSMVVTDFRHRGVPWVALQVRQRQVSSALNLDVRNRLSAALTVGVVAAFVARRTPIAIAAVIAVIAVNRRLYALAARRHGWSGAAAGVGLHAVHHLTAVASVPVGLGAAIRAGDHRRNGVRSAA
ncbi:MAG: glycosyltransferase [Actinomycetota bacterium]